MAIMISKKHLASSHIAPKPKTNSWRRHQAASTYIAMVEISYAMQISYQDEKAIVIPPELVVDGPDGTKFLKIRSTALPIVQLTCGYVQIHTNHTCFWIYAYIYIYQWFQYLYKLLLRPKVEQRACWLFLTSYHQHDSQPLCPTATVPTSHCAHQPHVVPGQVASERIPQRCTQSSAKDQRWPNLVQWATMASQVGEALEPEMGLPPLEVPGLQPELLLAWPLHLRWAMAPDQPLAAGDGVEWLRPEGRTTESNLLCVWKKSWNCCSIASPVAVSCSNYHYQFKFLV